MRRIVIAALVALTALLLVVGGLSGPASAAEVEDYAAYQPQTNCAPRAKAGTKVLSRWLVRRYGGDQGPMSRRCGSGGTSEHKEGRALDWILDASRKKDRKRARAFLGDAFGEDKHGNPHAKARRMGIMYLIWNDHMYAAWDAFAKEDYLSSSCKSAKKCSKTLRHRDHLHVSLNRKGGKGRTSWYDGRLD